ncbi:hypothetical protein ABKV19_011271 [Rosa sericea]
MVTVPGQLIWEIVKKNNSLVKQFAWSQAGVRRSVSTRSLTTSTTSTPKSIPVWRTRRLLSIQAGGKDQSMVLATTKTRKQNKPTSLVHKSVMRKDFRCMAKAVTNQVPNTPFTILWNKMNDNNNDVCDAFSFLM